MRLYSQLISAAITVQALGGASIAGEFIPLGDLVRPQGISDDGSTVVGGIGTELGPLRWTRETGVEPLSSPGVTFDSGSASAASADGAVIVGYLSEIKQGLNHVTQFRWTASEGFVSLGDLPGAEPEQGGVGWAGARGISPNGEFIVGSSRSVDEAFRWTESGGIAGLGDLPGGAFSSTAFDVSNNGKVVGWSSVDPPEGSGFTSPDEAFLWNEGDGMVGLGDLLDQNFQSRATRISPEGDVVVGWSALVDTGCCGGGPDEAFRWSDTDGMVGLGMLAGHANSQAYGVSANGKVIVGGSGINSSTDASFIWSTAAGMRNLQDLLSEDASISEGLAGWTLQIATDVSADGQTITGYGMNPDGNLEGWVATLSVPEPSGLAIMLVTVTCAATLRRRWRRVS